MYYRFEKIWARIFFVCCCILCIYTQVFAAEGNTTLFPASVQEWRLRLNEVLSNNACVGSVSPPKLISETAGKNVYELDYLDGIDRVICLVQEKDNNIESVIHIFYNRNEKAAQNMRNLWSCERILYGIPQDRTEANLENIDEASLAYMYPIEHAMLLGMMEKKDVTYVFSVAKVSFLPNDIVNSGDEDKNKSSGSGKKLNDANMNHSIFTTQIFDLVNAERVKHGAAPLRWDEKLMQAAQARSEELPVKYAHTRPDGREFCTITSRLDKYCCGENIAAGYKTPEEVVHGWMESPGHRENILRKGFKYIGLGYHYEEGSDFGHYWVQIFAMDSEAEVHERQRKMR